MKCHLCLALTLIAPEVAQGVQVIQDAIRPDEVVVWEGYPVQQRWVPLLEMEPRVRVRGPRVADEVRFLAELEGILPLPEGTRIELLDPSLPTWRGAPEASLRLVHEDSSGTFAHLLVPLDLGQVFLDGLPLQAHPVPGKYGTPLPLSLLGSCLEIQRGALASLELEGLRVETRWLRHDPNTLGMELEIAIEEAEVPEGGHPGVTILTTSWHLSDHGTPEATAARVGARLALEQGERRRIMDLLEPLHGEIHILLDREQGRTPMHYAMGGHGLYFELEGSTEKDLTFTLGDVQLDYADFVALTELARRACSDGAWLADISVFPVDTEDPLPWQRAMVVTAAGPGKPGNVTVIEWPRGAGVDQGTRHDASEVEVESSGAILHDPWSIRFGEDRRLRVSIDSGESVFCSHGMPGPEMPLLDQEQGRSLLLRW